VRIVPSNSTSTDVALVLVDGVAGSDGGPESTNDRSSSDRPLSTGVRAMLSRCGLGKMGEPGTRLGDASCKHTMQTHHANTGRAFIIEVPQCQQLLSLLAPPDKFVRKARVKRHIERLRMYVCDVTVANACLLLAHAALASQISQQGNIRNT